MLAPPAEAGIPFSLAEVLRVVDGGELQPGEPPYLMVNLWKVKLAEPHAGRPNTFGRWTRTQAREQREDGGEPMRRRRRVDEQEIIEVRIRNVMVWPVRLA